jgi:hypothetical protein
MPSAPSTLWQPPADVLAIGTAVRVPYTPGPPASEGTEQRPIDPRIHALEAEILTHWPIQQFYAGGRAWSGQQNIDMHLAGRALDVMVPNRATGDEVANWFMRNVVRLQLQYMIWYKVSWGTVNGTDQRAFAEYMGAADHRDHVHVEVTPPGIVPVLPASTTSTVVWVGGLVAAGVAAGWLWDRWRR